jgi:PAS domain-containing protein
MSASAQKPLELIQARNLLSSLSTPTFLVNRDGDVVFYNEAAGAILGQRYEETGTLSAYDWVCRFGPFDDDGEPLFPVERQPLTPALRANRAGHAHHRIRSAAGVDIEVEVSGVPIVGADGFLGAMVFFWPIEEEQS